MSTNDKPTINYNDPSSLNKFQRFFYEYGRYHRNTINILIHIVCIPIITLTFFLMFDHLSFKILNLPFNTFYIIFAIWVPIYIYTDFFTGLITSIQYPLLYYWVKPYMYSFTLFGLSPAQSIVVIHVVSWLLQFIGHGKFEKRKPALMDNVLLMFNAPVFVVMEILMVLGYRQKEIRETQRYIDADIAQFRKTKKI
jgi:2-hydroxy fatty acid dioxygenase